MKITILTMFPEQFTSFLNNPVLLRAKRQNALDIRVIDIKDYAKGSFRKIDDSPYGGGLGMIMKIEPLVACLRANASSSCKILLSPKGKTFDQQLARELKERGDITLICGHYEGVDARIEYYIDEQISIGDFILTGGELPAMMITDAVIRLLDGVMKDGVTEDESFENNLLEYPQYTRPYDFEGHKVPDILLSGHDARISEYNHEMAIRETAKYRPDLLKKS